ncbi:MAG: ATP/GTP-binding protein [Thermofilaceae archaeon]|nr:ATP/GTP-binding protein [Thermofilaceae archaeon]MDW8003380.1 ATP/GTP-binding protein [Thermofilaceae archaeon]
MHNVSLGRALYTVIIGPAGSGKTTLTAALGRWIEENQGFRVSYVNLDPGADQLPFKADVDVRDWVTVQRLMRERGLGPNGALIACMEEVYARRSEVLARISKLPAEFVLIDTPGQMELFLFHDAGPAVSRELKKLGSACAVMLFDSSLARVPSHFATLNLMGVVARLQLEIPVVIALNKGDLANAPRAGTWARNPNILLNELRKEPGVISELAGRLVEILNEFNLAVRIPIISSLTQQGFGELYDLIHEIWCACGDLT